jgi:hypothetical protein
MHTFDIGQAISEGLKAFGQKALPLILITLIGGGLSLLVQFVIIGSSLNGLGVANVDSNGDIQIENSLNQGFSNLGTMLQNPEIYEGNEEDIAREISEGFGFDYDQLEAITADGEVSDFEALSAYGGSSFNPLAGLSFGKIAIGFLISAIISLAMGIAIGTVSLDAVFGRKFDSANITKNFSKVPAFIIFAIIMMVAALLNIVPILGFIAYMVIYLMVIQAPFIMLEESKGAIDSIKRSNELMKGNKLKLFALLLIGGIVGAILGTVTLGIGYLIVLPAIACIMAHVYKQLSQGVVATAADKVKQAVS